MKRSYRYEAREVLAKANQGYSQGAATQAAEDSTRQMPSDLRRIYCRRIVAGDADMIELYRWPLKPSRKLLKMLAE